MYVLPSVSTFTNRNPSITWFEYDRDTFELLDYTVRRCQLHTSNVTLAHSFTRRQQVYFTNLSSTNARDAPEFVEFYAAKAYFGIDDLSPERCKKLPLSASFQILAICVFALRCTR